MSEPFVDTDPLGVEATPIPIPEDEEEDEEVLVILEDEMEDDDDDDDDDDTIKEEELLVTFEEVALDTVATVLFVFTSRWGRRFALPSPSDVNLEEDRRPPVPADIGGTFSLSFSALIFSVLSIGFPLLVPLLLLDFTKLLVILFVFVEEEEEEVVVEGVEGVPEEIFLLSFPMSFFLDKIIVFSSSKNSFTELF